MSIDTENELVTLEKSITQTEIQPIENQTELQKIDVQLHGTFHGISFYMILILSVVGLWFLGFLLLKYLNWSEVFLACLSSVATVFIVNIALLGKKDVVEVYQLYQKKRLLLKVSSNESLEGALSRPLLEEGKLTQLEDKGGLEKL